MREGEIVRGKEEKIYDSEIKKEKGGWKCCILLGEREGERERERERESEREREWRGGEGFIEANIIMVVSPFYLFINPFCHFLHFDEKIKKEKGMKLWF